VSTLYQAPPRPPGFFADIYAGAVHGDFAPRLGIPGALTQIVLGFVPVIGTVCAARDFVANRRKGDRLGAVLNALALIPFLGGFPKTAAVIHSVRHVGKVWHAMRRNEHNKSATTTTVPPSYPTL
jgi:hypothetical protein